MKTTRVQSRIASFMIASVLLFPISPVLADSPAATMGDQDRDRRAVDVTFTKWITIVPGYPHMEGVVGGNVAGRFSGEVLVAQTTVDTHITRLEAVYEIHTGNRSFTALIQGGQNNQTGKAQLDGTILGGWRTGDRVHVKYDVIGCPEPNAFQGTCFQGTIHIARVSEE